MKEQVILIAGNPVDGLAFYGPFDDTEEAGEYADTNRIDEWWTATIQNPPH